MRKNKLILFSSILAPTVVAIPMMSAACKNNSNSIAIKTDNYSDLMNKLLNKSINLAGAYADANRQYNLTDADQIKVIGATEIISNDGIQARSDLKQTDIDAICWLFQKAIEASKTDPALQIQKGGKTQSVFKIYSHSAYSKLSPNSKIKYDFEHSKAAYNGVTPAAGGDYFKLQGADYAKKDGSANLKIQFIPSNDPTNIASATAKLKAYFVSLGFNNIELTTSISYNAAATALANKSIDVAFLPADTWATQAGKSLFILQAGRPVQIIDPYKSITLTSEPALTSETNELELIAAMNNYMQFDSVNTGKQLYLSSEAAKRPSAVTTGFNATLKAAVDNIPTGVTLPPVGYYRSYIYARTDSEIYKVVTKAIQDQGANWKLKWSEVKDMIEYGYTSTSSSASYTYPEQWFIKHFEGFKSFND